MIPSLNFGDAGMVGLDADGVLDLARHFDGASGVALKAPATR